MKECKLCGSRENLQQHHVVPLSRGGDPGFQNRIWVCKECHAKLHPECSELVKASPSKEERTPKQTTIKETQLRIRCDEKTKEKFKSPCTRHDWTYEEGIEKLLQIARKHNSLGDSLDKLSVGFK